MREPAFENRFPAFELEMDEAEFEAPDEELDSMLEVEMYDFEAEAEQETDIYERAEKENPYTERLFELAQSDFEADGVEQELNEVLDSMEREYFWGALASGIATIAGDPRVRSAAKGLIRKGLKFARKHASQKELLHAGTSLLRGKLKGLLLPAMKTAIQSVSNAANMDEQGADSGQHIIADTAEAAQEAYEFAAANLHEDVDSEAAAHELAEQAFEVGIRQRRGMGMLAYQKRRQETGTRVVRLHRRTGETIRKVVLLID